MLSSVFFPMTAIMYTKNNFLLQLQKMKKYNLLFLTILICASLHAQEASIVSRLRQFSPLADIYIRNLGMEDRNSNGTIDRGAGEGYETFIEKYGNADVGFHANGVIFGANNGRLEENEIINHYYINIRFKDIFTEETDTIDKAVKSYVYANNIPLVWLDDEQGTVMNAVTGILGESWNEREVSEDEAVRMFERTMRGLRMAGRQGIPSRNGGYHTLPEMVNRREGFCFEAAQFAFWFFSELKKNSLVAYASFAESLVHDILILTETKTEVDYFGSSSAYNYRGNWFEMNPFMSIGNYYSIAGRVGNNFDISTIFHEQAFLYDKYNIARCAFLISAYSENSNNQQEIINLGEFILQNIDIALIMNKGSRETVHNLKLVLQHMLIICFIVNNRTGFDNVRELLVLHYSNDAIIEEFLRHYRW